MVHTAKANDESSTALISSSNSETGSFTQILGDPLTTQKTTVMVILLLLGFHKDYQHIANIIII